jgi:hypothetical protein
MKYRVRNAQNPAKPYGFWIRVETDELINKVSDLTSMTRSCIVDNAVANYAKKILKKYKHEV